MIVDTGDRRRLEGKPEGEGEGDDMVLPLV